MNINCYVLEVELNLNNLSVHFTFDLIFISAKNFFLCLYARVKYIGLCDFFILTLWFVNESRMVGIRSNLRSEKCYHYVGCGILRYFHYIFFFQNLRNKIYWFLVSM